MLSFAGSLLKCTFSAVQKLGEFCGYFYCWSYCRKLPVIVFRYNYNSFFGGLCRVRCFGVLYSDLAFEGKIMSCSELYFLLISSGGSFYLS